MRKEGKEIKDNTCTSGRREVKALMLNHDDSCKVCLCEAFLSLRIIELPACTYACQFCCFFFFFLLMELMERLMPLVLILNRHCMDSSISLWFCCPKSLRSARLTPTTGASAGKQQGAVQQFGVVYTRTEHFIRNTRLILGRTSISAHHNRTEWLSEVFL